MLHLFKGDERAFRLRLVRRFERRRQRRMGLRVEECPVHRQSVVEEENVESDGLFEGLVAQQAARVALVRSESQSIAEGDVRNSFGACKKRESERFGAHIFISQLGLVESTVSNFFCRPKQL